MRGNTDLAKLEQRTWLDRWLPDLRAELEALGPQDLIPLNIDVPSAISTVFGVLPKLALLRDRIAALPEFDLAAFDRLELYTHALWKVHVHYTTSVEAPDHLDELVKRGTLLREQLLADARSLALRGYLNPAALRNVKTQSGFKSLASDLLGLARVLHADWQSYAGKCPATEADLNQAEALGVALLRTVGRRPYARAIANAAELRLRTFTLFIRTYDDARRAVRYLCATKTDPNSIAPSLYGGRKRRKDRADEQQVSDHATADPEVTDGLSLQEGANAVRPGPFMPSQ